jgi:ubiquinone biosynthesis monooxygenase Coq6
MLRTALRRARVRPSSTVPWDFDVAIVGGGVVGSALACSLARLPSLASSRILVIESSSPPPLSVALNPARPPDIRTYAMTPASEKFLDSVNSWNPLVAAGRATPYGAMQVSVTRKVVFLILCAEMR